MASPFDGDGAFLVLANDHGQLSLWPAALPRPAGWTPAFGPAGRAECVDHVDQSPEVPG